MSSRCPLLRIPTEIRLLIYDYLYDWNASKTPIDAVSLPMWGTHPMWYHDLGFCAETVYSTGRYGKGVFQDLATLLRVSKFINEEITGLIYERTVFAINVQPNPSHSTHEFYELHSRRLGPIHQCSFLRRIQKVWITPVGGYCRKLSGLAAALLNILGFFESAPSEKAAVYLYIRDDSELDSLWSDEDTWERLLGDLSTVKGECQFQLTGRFLKELCGRERLDQLLDSVDGSAEICQLQHRTPTSGLYDVKLCRVEYVTGSKTAPTMLSEGDAGSQRVVYWQSGKFQFCASLERRAGRLWKD